MLDFMAFTMEPIKKIIKKVVDIEKKGGVKDFKIWILEKLKS